MRRTTSALGAALLALALVHPPRAPGWLLIGAGVWLVSSGLG